METRPIVKIQAHIRDGINDVEITVNGDSDAIVVVPLLFSIRNALVRVVVDLLARNPHIVDALEVAHAADAGVIDLEERTGKWN